MPSHDEETPLVIRVESCFPQRTIWNAVHAVPRLALSWHPIGAGLSLISALACWANGSASTRSIDVLLFKSILVIFGLTLGFRLVRANTRSSDAQAAVKQLLQSAITIVVLLPDASKGKCVEDILYLLDVFCSHLHQVSSRTAFWYNIMSLQPTTAALAMNESRSLGACTTRRVTLDASLSPRTLMASMMCHFGELICAPSSRNIEFMWRETRTRFIAAYDHIEVLALPSVCDNYALMIDILLAGFGLCLPWGVAVPGFGVRTGFQVLPEFHLASGLLLLLNTALITVTLFGLNGLAQEIEDPFHEYNRDDIDLRQAMRVFREKLLAYNKCWASCIQSPVYGATATGEGGPAGKVPQGTRWEVAVEVHRAMCPPPCDDAESGLGDSLWKGLSVSHMGIL